MAGRDRSPRSPPALAGDEVRVRAVGGAADAAAGDEVVEALGRGACRRST